MKIEHQEQLSLLKSGDKKALEEIYKQNEGKFVHWIHRHYPSLSHDDAKDVFQNAVIILHQNIQIGKLSELQSSISTYLFGIGGNLVKALIRKKANQPLPLDDLRQLDVPDELLSYAVNRDKMMGLLGRIGDKCRELLVSSLSTKLKSEEFARKLGYPSPEMYRKKKHDCIKQLKSIIEDHQLKIDDFLE